jgi:hypothetical protein
MMQGFGWAKNPIVKRIDKLDPEIFITLLYGSRSWIDNLNDETIKQVRSTSYINVQVILLSYCIIFFFKIMYFFCIDN